jgi:hypothetical protein
LVAVPAPAGELPPAEPLALELGPDAGDTGTVPEAAVAPPAGRAFADLLRAPLALIAASVVVTLAASCFFVAEAIALSDAGDVGGAAHLTGTILVAASNLVLALALAWIVVLLGRRTP